jgi:hypothetical protein
MMLINEGNANQTIKFIPRSNTYNTMIVTDESTNVSQNIAIISSLVGDYYNEIVAVFDLTKDTFYSLTIKNNNDIVFKDKIFISNQNSETYSPNQNVYTSHVSTNDFIIYE